MSDYTAIADVGESLIELLRNNMRNLIPNQDEIVLGSPGEIEAGDNVRLSLFLYQVLENIYLKNQKMQTIDSTRSKHPPLALDLYYILTSHPSAQKIDRTDSTLNEHTILGRAMQILYDRTVLTGTDLKGSLDKANVELHLTLNPLNLDDLTKIWNTFQGKPFMTSVCYLVTPVYIDSAHPEVNVKRIFKRNI